MALTAAFLRRSRDLWLARERAAKKAADRAHVKHKLRSKQLAALNKPRFAYPIDNVITDAHGYKPGHDGIDLICPPNAPLKAICKSKVVRVSADGWWGNQPTGDVSKGDGIIILESLVTAGPFKKGLHFGYGHAEHATVRTGDIVEAGQVIGKAGFANAWHTHFMVNDDPPVNGLYRGVGDRDPKPLLTYAKEHSR